MSTSRACQCHGAVEIHAGCIDCDRCKIGRGIWITQHGFLCEQCKVQVMDNTPAHEVPFAYDPNSKVCEEFRILIFTPERPNYCGCRICREARRAVLQSMLENAIDGYMSNHDPFRLFPDKQESQAQ